ncbi:lipoxygenase homology domain-containing protein 1-like [Physella acuta]|uniref:lipoxygenase homology domain-containing protein 1-like n=1 Tax=Physella acuta TaxID=109671 RepID=UPI0027DCCD0F|nr:lipoxygenase homology domain-containing protein 1-like [Physella acuta]
MSITSSLGLLCMLMLFHSGYTEHILYRINVRTGDVAGAGTDARIYIILHGARGSTDRIGLPDDEGDKFERGSLDSFTVSAENVGRLRSITIGHDNKMWRPGWFLRDVRIYQNVEPGYEHIQEPGFNAYQFNWNNWIASNELDGTIVKTISVAS